MVFYTGFTRECLRGECELSPEQMLDKVEEAVAKVSEGKKVRATLGRGRGNTVAITNAFILQARCHRRCRVPLGGQRGGSFECAHGQEAGRQGAACRKAW